MLQASKHASHDCQSLKIKFSFQAQNDQTTSGNPRICLVNNQFWPDIVRWPAVISSPAAMKMDRKINIGGVFLMLDQLKCLSYIENSLFLGPLHYLN